MTTERNNEEWLSDLSGEQQSQALEDLRQILSNGLYYALSGRVDSAQLDALVEDSVQEALLKILDNLHTFEGRSKFTTWTHKIAVRVALTELRRQRWKDVSLQDLLPDDYGIDYTPAVLTDPAPNPEELVTQTSVMEFVSRLLETELTERQRQAMLAVMVQGMPLEEVARRMDSNRNAMYKLLHDARQKLKKRLATDGISPEDLLAVFDTGS